MPMTTILLLTATFVIVFGVSCVAMALLRPSAVQRRVGQIHREIPGVEMPSPQRGWLRQAEKLARPLARISLPKEGWENSALRTRFIHAGWRQPEAMAVYFALKTLLVTGLPLVMWVLLSGHLDPAQQAKLPLAMFAAAVAGFYLPDLVLRHKVRRRQREIFESFPDSLDLIMVCVEAGLGLDAAVLRVVEEMRSARPAMAEEYELLTLELRAGLPREKAMRNLASRTGVEDVSMLVAMLIQADRFGTSVADSLRVHSDMLRTRRHMLAEERAAKIGTKILFPLIFCIFPSLFVVLLGPAAIQVITALRSVANQ
ncbi:MULTISPECIES: type II secretion system F family protein [unclassified Cupriavidus]|uniref:type II secretion system F family protein n=1 Tax=unclassified Cupriavidus TaxID=2640874 RepID=UPI0010F7871A|nr:MULTISPECIES: type II secretion system F family protein [unclassified Cupriavidus]MWL86439.1 type II secretion system F family protein [Cupriavidus sp. SW-Y-13]